MNSITTDLYYSSNWQVLEEREGTLVRSRNVWSPVYIDAMILRDRDVNGDGTLEERLWVHHDANFNVSSVLDNSGNVVERYAYDPHGNITVLTGSWVARSSSNYGWVFGHQGLRYLASVSLYEDRGRFFDPDSGRFIQVDPLGFRAGDVNLYAYLGNNPPNGLDPSGLAEIIRVDLLTQGGFADLDKKLFERGASPLTRAALEWEVVWREKLKKVTLIDPQTSRAWKPLITGFGNIDLMSDDKKYRFIGGQFALVVGLDERPETGGKVRKVVVLESSTQEWWNPIKKEWFVDKMESGDNKVEPVPIESGWFGTFPWPVFKYGNMTLAKRTEKGSEYRSLVMVDMPGFLPLAGLVGRRTIDARIEITDEQGNVRTVSYKFRIELDPEKPNAAPKASFLERPTGNNSP
jgi:RHS repeat-associated protein